MSQELKDAIQSWKSPFTHSRAFSPNQVQKQKERIDTLLAQVEIRIPSKFDLEKIYNTIRNSYRNRRMLKDLDKRTFRLSPWVMFQSFQKQEPLAKEQDFVNLFLDRLNKQPNTRTIKNLVVALLIHYPEDFPTFQTLLHSAKNLLERCTSSSAGKVLSDSRKMGLLEPDGPARFWKWFSFAKGAFEARFEGTFFPGELLYSEFIKKALHAGIRAARNHLDTPDFTLDSLESLLVLALDADEKRVKSRFGADMQIPLAEALLLPFQEKAVSPEFKKRIRDFVLDFYGDPRIDRARWQGVNPEAMHVVLSWLVEESLEFFFRLLKFFAQGDEVATRHWHYRKAFWTAYLQKGVIKAAWVVLAPKLDGKAKKAVGSEETAYGLFKTGVQSNHCALIMRINQLLITEWSHNGACRVWDEGEAGKGKMPRMYKSRYTGDELRKGSNHERIHHGAEKGRWQAKLSKYIRAKTGISIKRGEYMP